MAQAEGIGADASTQVVADAYDKVPYHSKPFAQSTPEQMAVMASLFGLKVPALETARVLELGCSSGGNLIPLAVRFPGMHCVGVDISKVEVAEGQEVLKELGLKNCELKALDITKAAGKLKGPFDYIICHGVFSWVPDAVREAILNLVRDKLAPEGVAYISYNVYPGWKMREVVREMMLFHAGNIEDPVQRLQQARAMVEFTTRNSPEQTAYGKTLRDEAQIVANADDYYVLHDHLEINNKPVYFREFAAMAGERKLGYLGEASVSDMAPQRLGAEVAETLNRLSQGNILATEQYMDFFTNRTFRQTLLVHEARMPSIKRALNPEQMRGYAFATSMVQDTGFVPVEGQGPRARYTDPFGRSLTAGSALSVAMVNALIAVKPYALGFAALADRVGAALGLAPEQRGTLENLLGTELLNLVVQNVVRLMHPLQAAVPALAKPKVNPLARAQARRGQNWVSSRFHQPAAMSPAHAVLLQLLDGSQDEAALRARVLQAFKAGTLSAQNNGAAITDETALQALAAQFTSQALTDFRNMGLLE